MPLARTDMHWHRELHSSARPCSLYLVPLLQRKHHGWQDSRWFLDLVYYQPKVSLGVKKPCSHTANQLFLLFCHMLGGLLVVVFLSSTQAARIDPFTTSKDTGNMLDKMQYLLFLIKIVTTFPQSHKRLSIKSITSTILNDCFIKQRYLLSPHNSIYYGKYWTNTVRKT